MHLYLVLMCYYTSPDSPSHQTWDCFRHRQTIYIVHLGGITIMRSEHFAYKCLYMWTNIFRESLSLADNLRFGPPRHTLCCVRWIPLATARLHSYLPTILTHLMVASPEMCLTFSALLLIFTYIAVVSRRLQHCAAVIIHTYHRFPHIWWLRALRCVSLYVHYFWYLPTLQLFLVALHLCAAVTDHMFLNASWMLQTTFERVLSSSIHTYQQFPHIWWLRALRCVSRSVHYFWYLLTLQMFLVTLKHHAPVTNCMFLNASRMLQTTSELVLRSSMHTYQHTSDDCLLWIVSYFLSNTLILTSILVASCYTFTSCSGYQSYVSERIMNATNHIWTVLNSGYGISIKYSLFNIWQRHDAEHEPSNCLYFAARNTTEHQFTDVSLSPVPSIRARLTDMHQNARSPSICELRIMLPQCFKSRGLNPMLQVQRQIWTPMPTPRRRIDNHMWDFHNVLNVNTNVRTGLDHSIRGV